MLSVILPTVALVGFIMLSVYMLNVIILNVIILIVVAPIWRHDQNSAPIDEKGHWTFSQLVITNK